MFKKIISVGAVAVMASSMLCGCGENKDSEFPTKAQYGLAITEVNRPDIYLIYDGMYVSNDEMNALADFYVSIQEKDVEKYSSFQPADYLDFLAENNNMDVAVILSGEYQNVANEIGDTFDFSKIEVTDAGDRTKDKGIQDIMDMVDGIYSDMGKDKKFSDTVKDAKYVIYDLYAEVGSEQYVMNSQTKYIFNCEDGIYIF